MYDEAGANNDDGGADNDNVESHDDTPDSLINIPFSSQLLFSWQRVPPKYIKIILKLLLILLMRNNEIIYVKYEKEKVLKYGNKMRNLKLSFQSKAPHLGDREGLYSNVSIFITSIWGEAILFLLQNAMIYLINWYEYYIILWLSLYIYL